MGGLENGLSGVDEAHAKIRVLRERPARWIEAAVLRNAERLRIGEVVVTRLAIELEDIDVLKVGDTGPLAGFVDISEKLRRFDSRSRPRL